MLWLDKLIIFDVDRRDLSIKVMSIALNETSGEVEGQEVIDGLRRSQFSLVVSLYGKGYIVGGHDGNGYAADVESICVSSLDGERETVAQLRYPRAAPLVSCGAHGYLVVMGGCPGSSAASTIIELINLQSGAHIQVELSMAAELDVVRTSLNRTTDWKIHPTHHQDKVWLSQRAAGKHNFFCITLSQNVEGETFAVLS